MIIAALSRKVQELELNLDEYDADESFMLPHCLCTSQSLTIVKLHLSFEHKLPSNMCLPNLKNLKLSNVTFVDDHSTQLFDGCPNLQELYLCDCAWKDLKFFYSSSPTLKFLSISDLLDEGAPPSDCQVVICGTNLKFFSYYGDLKTVFCLYSSSLVEGYIDLEFGAISEWDGIEREAAYRVHKLLMGLASVESLELSPVALEVLANGEELHPHLPVLHMPVFDKLTRIKFLYSFVPVHVDCGIFQRLLHNLPHLDCLDFEPELKRSCIQ